MTHRQSSSAAGSTLPTRTAQLLQHPLGLTLALQLGWWACVGGAATGRELLGPIGVALLLGLQTYGLEPRERRAILAVAAILALVGSGLDSVLVALGLLAFEGDAHILLVPLWITALWAHFATSLDAFYRIGRGRSWVLPLLGAVGGPLAYQGGAAAGAAELHPEVWPSLLGIGLVWGAVLPLACWLRRAVGREVLAPSGPVRVLLARIGSGPGR